MACERYLNAIHELIDGTLGPIRRSELELHLESCDDCRALAGDLRELARASRELEDMPVPPRAWQQIAGRLQQEGRARIESAAPAWYSNRAVLALAATLLLVVAASLFAIWPSRGTGPVAPPAATAAAPVAPAPAAAGPDGNVNEGDVVQSLEQSAANLEAAYEQARKLRALDAGTSEALQNTLLIVNEAVKDTRVRLTANPQDIAAHESFYDTLKQKIRLLRNTITLMNEIRQGDAAGAAQVVEGGKS